MTDGTLAGVVDEITAEATPATERVRICTRGDLIARLRLLEDDLEAAQRDDAASNKHDRAPKIAREIETVEAEARASEKELVLHAIGATAWSDLLAAFPPSKAQREQFRGLDHDPEKFPYAAVAASLGADLSDKESLTEAAGKVRKMADKLSQGQWSQIWTACLAVNVGEVSVPFSVRAFAARHGSEQNSTPAEPGESPDPSS